METCEVPCKTVDLKIRELWECVRQKVSLRIAVYLFCTLIGIFSASQWILFGRLSDLKSEIKIELTQQSKDLEYLKKGVGELQEKIEWINN